MKTSILALSVLLSAIAPGFTESPDNSFVAHEWGTFTSVQGADGAQMIWNPLSVSELPRFVYERNRVLAGKPAIGLKSGLVCLQRMETPVIYFYSEKTQVVDVSVKFPQGQITEWYPQESAAGADLQNSIKVMTGQRPALQWDKVEILSKADAAKTTLLTGPEGSHYYAARETDANVLRVTAGEKKTEVEKFLFYRGTGSFQAPLTVRLDSTDARRMTLTNTGKEELGTLFVYEVRANGVSWFPLEKLKVGETRPLNLEATTAGDSPALAAALRAALVRDGLFEKEASAMVKTWESSWLGEPGLRVLYTLPRAWTDRTLPLGITPAPQATARVMVGRAEVITPAMEKALLVVFQRYLAAPTNARPQIVADARALGLGRFAEPTMRRVLTAEKRTPEFAAGSQEFLKKMSAPEKTATLSAAR